MTYNNKIEKVHNIAITFDNDFVQHACVMLQSLKSHNSRPINVYCVYNNLTQKNIEILLNHFAGTNLSLFFKQFNLQDLVSLPIQKTDHVTLTTYLRIWLPQILNTIDQVLFIDCDIIVDGDISYLLDLNIDGEAVAAVTAPGIDNQKKKDLGIPNSKNYFNAGLLKINLEYFRANNLTGQILEFIDQYPGKCEYWDQDALNGVLAGNYVELDYKYNMSTIHFDERITEDPLYKNRLGKPVIIHFTGGGYRSKPWFYANQHPLKHLYYQHLHQTPFRNYVPPDQPKESVLSRLRRTIFKNHFSSLAHTSN